jgi:hypothetical protein
MKSARGLVRGREKIWEEAEREVSFRVSREWMFVGVMRASGAAVSLEKKQVQCDSTSSSSARSNGASPDIS